jgi:hypothetical protein
MDLQFLEILLGSDIFFVPCEWGTKRPLATYVERRHRTETQHVGLNNERRD